MICRHWRNLTRNSGNHLSLLMLDVDRFKRFNDRHGHLAGDACLRQIAHIIQNTLRRPRDFVARYGGEEFAVVLPDTKLAGACVLAERIRATVARCRSSSECLGLSAVTLSVGVASADAATLSEGDRWSDLVRRADEALYAATGATATEFNSDFKEHLNRSFNMASLFMDTMFFWLGLAVIVIIGTWLRIRKKKRYYRKWEQREQLESTDFEYGDPDNPEHIEDDDEPWRS